MQLKEKKIFYAESITGERYTSALLFSFLSRQERTSLENKYIVRLDPPSKNAYRKIFLRFEIAGYKNLPQVVELQEEKWGDVCELAIDVWIWLTPDPAGQFFNPYAYGGDPVNFTDPDGEFVFALIIGAAIGAYIANQRGYGLDDWQTYVYIGGGALLGGGAAFAGAAAGASAASGLGLTTATGGLTAGGTLVAGTVGGAVGGAIGAAGNYTLGSGIETGFSNFNAGDFGRAALIGGAAGAAGGFIGSGIGLTSSFQSLQQAGGFQAGVADFFQGAYSATGATFVGDLADNGRLDLGPGDYAGAALIGGGASVVNGMARRAHYRRNENQKAYENDAEFQSDCDAGNYCKTLTRGESLEHNPDVNYKRIMSRKPLNWFRRYGEVEGVFNRETLISDFSPKYMATYNHGQNIFTHTTLDYLPYKYWGNTPGIY